MGRLVGGCGSTVSGGDTTISGVAVSVGAIVANAVAVAAIVGVLVAVAAIVGVLVGVGDGVLVTKLNTKLPLEPCSPHTSLPFDTSNKRL